MTGAGADLSGARVLVAGGTSGVGIEISRLLVTQGAKLSICGRDPESLQRALETLNSGNGSAVGWNVDLTDDLEVREWLDRSRTSLGGIDALIANAGGNPAGGGWLDTLAANLGWVARVAELVHADLAASGGSLVTLSSIAATYLSTGADHAAYSASKAALGRYTVELAREWGPDGIRVNCVSPGPILMADGHWGQVARDAPAQLEHIVGRTALGRLVTGTEIASAVAFLVSGSSSGVTGVDLRVDAGMTLYPDR